MAYIFFAALVGLQQDVLGAYIKGSQVLCNSSSGSYSVGRKHNGDLGW